MSRRPPVVLLVGAPLLLLVAGGVAGYVTRVKPTAAPPAVTVVGASMPALDVAAPIQPLPHAPNTAVFDPAAILGLDLSGRVAVPAGAAVHLPLAAGGVGDAVDPDSHEAVSDAFVPDRRPVDATPGGLPPIAATPNTQAPPDDGSSAPDNAPPGTDVFTDPCATAQPPCVGAAGSVTGRTPDTAGDTVDPLTVSMPLAAEAGYAELCNRVEAGSVPEPGLAPASRPTVMVLLNQPSTVALTGTWADGSTLDKTTMTTLPADDTEWNRAWSEQHAQRLLAACITLPLDLVRSHAKAGAATLHVEVLAISASGRAESEGQVLLTIPTDDTDPLFVDRLTVADHGEQRLADGLLYPTVHVHYAIVANAVVPAGSTLDPAKVQVYAEHALVDGGDCNGWAAEQQARDRSAGSTFTVRSEIRTVSGRDRDVTVVDGDTYLDPTLPGGWQGQFCLRLTGTDGVVAKVFTLALLGGDVRSPRTADYRVSVLLSDPALPDGRQLQVAWSVDDGTMLCNPATLTTDNGERTGTCSTIARLAPEGILVALRIVGGDAGGTPLLGIRVPVNTGYCNPDDPWAWVGDGCSTGFNQPLRLPIGDGAVVRVVLQVNRSAAEGSIATDPSNAWQLGPVSSFLV